MQKMAEISKTNFSNESEPANVTELTQHVRLVCHVSILY